MIIFIHGKDTYRSHQRVDQLKTAFIKKHDKTGLGVVTLDSEELTLDEFEKKTLSVGLLEKRRFILIKNLIEQNNDTALFRGIIDFLKQKKFPEENILIFWEGDLEEIKGKEMKKGEQNLKKALIFELLKEKAEEFEYLTPLKLKQWVQNEIKKRKGKIDKKAQEALIAKVGQDLWQMDNEIEKLVHYCRGRIILEKDVQKFVQAKFDENIFHLTDALGEKNRKLALQLIQGQLESGTEPLLLLSKIIWQFRNLIQVNELASQGAPYRVIADKLRLHPFVVQKIIPQTKRFNIKKLKEIYQSLQDLDFKLKNTNTDPELLFDLLVLRVCE